MFIMEDSDYSRRALKVWSSVKSRPNTSVGFRKSDDKYSQTNKSSNSGFKFEKTLAKTNFKSTKSSRRYQSYAAYH